MKYQFFVIPAQNPKTAQEELNRFCDGCLKNDACVLRGGSWIDYDESHLAGS
ncbi:MAG: hypothetical protein PVI90_01730 [Desulfobacteraceae bacterium]|jgi:hypothetical protein